MSNPLFKAGYRRLSSGVESHWKVECDSLTREDWAVLAVIAMEQFDLRFCSAKGVPTGGFPFAAALQSYRTSYVPCPYLVVDDVLTTGNSIQREREKLGIHNTIGLVAFARGPLPDGVHAVWHLGGTR